MAYQKFRKNRCEAIAFAIVADRFAYVAGYSKGIPDFDWDEFVKYIGESTVDLSGINFPSEISQRERDYIKERATHYAKKLVSSYKRK